MSQATDRIAYYWYGKGESNFLTPASMLSEDDKALVEAGVLYLSHDELYEIRCPFGCGEFETIHILPRLDGKGEGHFVFCSETGEEKELEPRDYQLYAFDPQAMLRYGKPIKNATIKNRKKIHPRDTNWIRIEREAVLDYANDPRRNTANKEPHELCDHVWNLNRVEFAKASSLPVGQRGYKNAAALKAYFYRKRGVYLKRKYAVENLS